MFAVRHCSIKLSTGKAQECVLSHLHFKLLSENCSIKFSTSEVCSGKKKKPLTKAETKPQISQCGHNNLRNNVNKTKKLSVSSTKQGVES